MLKTARSLTLFDLSVGRARAQHSLTPTQRGVLRPAHGRLIGPAGAEGLDVRGLDGVLQRQLRWPREARLGPRPGLIVDPDRRLYVSSPARRPDPLTLAFEHPELESLCGPKPPRLRRLASPPARRYRGRAIAIARSGRVLQADDRSPRWLNWLDPESGRGRALQLANEHLEARRRCASPDGPVAAIDAEGVAFLAIHDLLGAFDAGGRHLFTLRAPAPIVCGPVLTPNASLILGLDDGMLLVVQ